VFFGVKNLEIWLETLQSWYFEFVILVFESQLEKRVQIVAIIFEMIRGECEEALEYVEPCKNWLNLGIFEQFPHISLELRPCIIAFWQNRTSYLADSVCDVFFHAKIALLIDDFEKMNFQIVLHFSWELFPDICVWWGRENGHA